MKQKIIIIIIIQLFSSLDFQVSSLSPSLLNHRRLQERAGGPPVERAQEGSSPEESPSQPVVHNPLEGRISDVYIRTPNSSKVTATK